ncbi:ABC transporter substrate-binding protein [Aphanothece sacrum]|uniref:Extracellular solute-binding protein family 1 n=1 Tax=Aphanothece sacrum FPU1 TaxID=1920663 RepID=A0A401IMN0_APHSA|nr:ABC transporter substrate-binding protein [Aphanothece sacrum]GBF82507.1 extracellular solute-binding protein family 1 [Aphanothece sacrum FPU1]GBF85759.1 extracellular solute-binding protein family 5 [Aphanothece sacrum FPU3]
MKRIFAIILIILCLFPLTACAQKANANQVVLAVLSDPKTFNAVLSQESPNIFGLTYEGLITENPITGIKEPALAESWDISDDKLTITFTLKERLKWSDGKPLTVDDVVFTYNDLYLNPKIPNNYRDSFRIGRQGTFPQIKKLDERRIEFKITEPFAPFLDNAGVPILPAHILRKNIEKKDKEGNPEFLTVWGTDTPVDKIIVNGPYKLKEYATSQRIIFEKNPYYWKKDEKGNQLPNIEQVIWTIVESPDTSLLQFRSGSLDSISITPDYFSLLKREEERGNFTVYNGGAAFGTNFMAFNLNQGKRDGKPLVDPIKSAWFNNLNFRKAIAYGMDRERMVNNIYRGLGQPQNTQISVQSPFYNKKIEGYHYNPEKAKELLLKEGFKYNKAGELLDAKGNKIRFSLITNAGNKIREAMGAQIKEDLRKLGIQIDFSPLAFNVLVDKLSDSLDWEAHILGFTGGNEPHAPNIWYIDGNLHMFNQKPQPGAKPLTGQVFADWEKQIEDLSVKGSQELELKKRKEIYDQTQTLVSEYLPFIYLVNGYSLAAVRNRFNGIQHSALGGTFWNIDEIYVKDNE